VRLARSASIASTPRSLLLLSANDRPSTSASTRPRTRISTANCPSFRSDRTPVRSRDQPVRSLLVSAPRSSVLARLTRASRQRRRRGRLRPRPCASSSASPFHERHHGLRSQRHHASRSQADQPRESLTHVVLPFPGPAMHAYPISPSVCAEGSRARMNRCFQLQSSTLRGDRRHYRSRVKGAARGTMALGRGSGSRAAALALGRCTQGPALDTHVTTRMRMTFAAKVTEGRHWLAVDTRADAPEARFSSEAHGHIPATSRRRSAASTSSENRQTAAQSGIS
jgi:hypothetical protein